MNKKIRVIARGSRLSRLQVEEVFKKFPNLAYEIKYLESYGDKNLQISLLNGEAPADIFTRELDDAIRRGDADIAIHSAKDLPYPLPEDIEVIALFPAFDTTDSLVSRDHKKLAELPAGSVIGTSSPLRKKGLSKLRPDLTIKGIRGCIEERVQQVKDGKFDAAIVATCALKRLGMEDEIAEVLPFATHPLQGFLAITAKKVKSEERRENAKKENAPLGVPADLQISCKREESQACLNSSECSRNSLQKSDGKERTSENTDKYTHQELRAAFASQSILDRQGKVQLVGFGPGDPDLLTLKAAKAIDHADIIFYDDLIDPSYLENKKAEKVYVGKRAGYHHKEQATINRLLLDAARQGKNVVRLKGGDPMIFAHGSEEIEYLESNLIQVEVIPGVTTASALAASQKISLTHRDFSSSVALVSGHTPQPVTPDAETLVYYMGAKQLQAIATKLIDEDGWAFNTPVLLTYNVSRKDEQTFETTLWKLRNGEEATANNYSAATGKNAGESIALADLPTPLIALIGNVAGLKHRQASAIKPTLYTGNMPALEKRKPDYTYTPLIEMHEYEPVHWTQWEGEPEKKGGDNDRKSNFEKEVEEDNEDGLEFDEYEWAEELQDNLNDFDSPYKDIFLFTSQYAVKAWFNLLRKTGKSTAAPKDVKFVSIGATTTAALQQEGIKDIEQVEKDNSFGVIEWFKNKYDYYRNAAIQHQKRNWSELYHSEEEEEEEENEDLDENMNEDLEEHRPAILYPQSNLSNNTIAEELYKAGYDVETISVYVNKMPKHPRRVNLNHFKRIVFTSPSTIDNFIKLYGKLPDNVEFITRGPITQAHLDEILNKE